MSISASALTSCSAMTFIQHEGPLNCAQTLNKFPGSPPHSANHVSLNHINQSCGWFKTTVCRPVGLAPHAGSRACPALEDLA